MNLGENRMKCGFHGQLGSLAISVSRIPKPFLIEFITRSNRSLTLIRLQMVVASTFVVIGTIVEFVTAVNATTSVRLMLRLPARSSFNLPVVPGLEHGLGVVGADEGVGTVILACVPQFHDHTLPHVHALVIGLRQSV